MAFSWQRQPSPILPSKNNPLIGQVIRTFEQFGEPNTIDDSEVEQSHRIVSPNATITATQNRMGSLFLEVLRKEPNDHVRGDITKDGQEYGHVKSVLNWLDFLTYQLGVTDLKQFIQDEQMGPHHLDTSWQHGIQMGLLSKTKTSWGSLKLTNENNILVVHGTHNKERGQTTTHSTLTNQGKGIMLNTRKGLEWIEHKMAKPGRFLLHKTPRPYGRGFPASP